MGAKDKKGKGIYSLWDYKVILYYNVIMYP